MRSERNDSGGASQGPVPGWWDLPLLDAHRIRLYTALTAVAFLAIWAIYAFSGSGLVAADGQPIGADFRSYYAAGTLADSGEPSAAYDSERFRREEERVTPGAAGHELWSYPPALLLVAEPLARLPYLVAYAIWATTLLMVYLVCLRAIFPARGILVAGFAFGGCLLSVSQGQNGCLSAALIGFGLLLLEERPLASGAVLGLLTYKPQLAIALPLLLLATGRWRTLFGFAASAGVLVALTCLVFGAGTWEAFLSHAGDAPLVLREGGFKLEKMPTVTSALLLAHVPFAAAITAQGVVGVAAVATTISICRQQVSAHIKAAAIAATPLLCTPYAYDYDLAILAVSGALLAVEASQSNWLPGEKLTMVGVWTAARPSLRSQK